MDDEEKEANRARYEARHAEFGYDPRTLGWTKGRHRLRYEILLEPWSYETASVLDVGCGFGDMYAYCQDTGRAHWRYTGIDIVPALINEGRQRYPQADLRLHDMDRDGMPGKHDVIVASGVFSFRIKDNLAYIERCCERFAKAARRGFAVNFMSPVADIRYDHLYYADPGEIMKIAARLSKRICLRHDYMPFEYTLQVHIDDSFRPDTVVFNSYERLIDRSDSAV